MALTLRVISAPAKTHGDEASMTFGPDGGTFGRSLTNDWVLPDPLRYVSSRHGRIDFENGHYWLTDTSTNGIYVNDDQHPMASGSRRVLRDGDRLRVGDYEIGVSISAEDTGRYVDTLDDLDFVLDPGEAEPTETLAQKSASAPQPASGRTIPPGGDLLDPKVLAPDPSPSGTGPANAFGQKLFAKAAAPARARAQRDAEKKSPRGPTRSQAEELQRILADDSSAGTPAPRRPPPAKREPAEAPTPEELQALKMLLKGAGIDAKLLAGESATRILQTAGQLLRETVLGLIETLQARTELKNVYRISQTTIQPGENNPLKFSAGVEDALRKLFVDQGTRYLSPVEAIRDSFRDIKIHHLALLAAMQTGLNEFLRRFEPDELQDKFDRGLKRGGLLGATNKMKYWDLYHEMYQILAQHPPEQPVPHLFGEEFARAYEGEVERLRAVHRSRSGGGK